MMSASGQYVPLEALTLTDPWGAMYRPLLKSLLQISAVVGQESSIMISAGSKPLRYRFDTLKSIERPVEDPFEVPRHLESVRDQRSQDKKKGGEEMASKEGGTERREQVGRITEQVGDAYGARSVKLHGLWGCRQAANLTQRQLASLVGGSQTTIRSLEALRRGAYPKTIRKLAEALEVSPVDLISRK
jgi:DNA-binding XRE family transcriptional regulator